jgi:hypothetical protein
MQEFRRLCPVRKRAFKEKISSENAEKKNRDMRPYWDFCRHDIHL